MDLHGFYVGPDDYRRIMSGVKTHEGVLGNPYLFVQPIEYMGPDTFRGFLGWHDPINDVWGFVSPGGLGNLSIYTDFRSKNPGYVTFDGIAFHRILAFYPTDDKVIIHLRLVPFNVGVKKDTAFMIMPFKSEILDHLYRDHIKPYLKEAMGIEVARSDEVADNDVVVETIYSMIDSAEIIIAEISEYNKNVFYEVGYAAAKGKEIIMLLQSGAEPDFFDRSHVRYIAHDPDKPELMKARLAETIKNIRTRLTS